MEKYKLVIKLSAVKELQLLPKKDLKKIIAKIKSLSDNPYPVGCEKLSGQERYRLRQGNYRVVYAIENLIRIVSIVKVGHRKEVYR